MFIKVFVGASFAPYIYSTFFSSRLGSASLELPYVP